MGMHAKGSQRLGQQTCQCRLENICNAIHPSRGHSLLGHAMIVETA